MRKRTQFNAEFIVGLGPAGLSCIKFTASLPNFERLNSYFATDPNCPPKLVDPLPWGDGITPPFCYFSDNKNEL